jgi:type IV pilus assembly protein PilC
MFVQMLRSGEVSGALSETLDRLASYLEFSVDLKRRVTAAMTYPLIVVAIAVLLFAGMMIWIVPAFEEIYRDLGGALPRPTQLLVEISRLIRARALHMLLCVAAAAVVLSRLKRTPWAGYAWDWLALRIPVFGTIRQKTALTRFAESLAQTLRNGIPILTALELSGMVTGNKVYERAIRNARVMVARGEPLSVTLRKERCFPGMLIKMVAVGEKTGTTDAMLARVAQFYGKEVSAMLTALTSLVEPMLIIVVGLLVGGMVLGMFLPIFKLHEIVVF